MHAAADVSVPEVSAPSASLEGPSGKVKKTGFFGGLFGMGGKSGKSASLETPDVSVPDVSTPDMPKVDVDTPDMPKVDVDAPDMPSVSAPDVPAPDMPKISGDMPDVSAPGLPDVDAKLDAPEVALPGIEGSAEAFLPGVKAPDMPSVDVDAPKLDADASVSAPDVDVSVPDADKPKMELGDVPVVGVAVGAVGAAGAGVAGAVRKPSGFRGLFSRKKKSEGMLPSPANSSVLLYASESCHWLLSAFMA